MIFFLMYSFFGTGVSAPSEISTLMSPTSCALSQLTRLIENFVEKLDLIVEQTRPRKAKKDEIASHLHRDVRENFFQCLRVSFSSELPRFKRFDDPTGNKSVVLLAEVVRYVGVMRTRYLAGQVDELVYVQPEIRDQFWPNIRSCLRNSQQCTMTGEKDYSFMVDNDAMEAIITGKTDHVIQPLDSDFASLTLEDKANCLKMSANEVSHVVTQVNFEVGRMEKFLNYAPVEYVGLLQNGPVWIAVLRKIDRGKVLWTYIQASPAFEVNEDSTNQRTATEINQSSCVEIARLIEHAYCTADKITEEIMYPERRPMNLMYTINEYRHHYDDDEDEEDQEQGNSKESGPPGKVGGAVTLAPVKQSATQEQQKQQQQNKSSAGRKKSHSDGNVSSQNSEYFILPLSSANVARHAAGVC